MYDILHKGTQYQPDSQLIQGVLKKTLLDFMIMKTVGFLRSLTVSIRIVADCMALSCQFTEKMKRATTLSFTTVSAIIFIHCCV